jgi:hypothetical protein
MKVKRLKVAVEVFIHLFGQGSRGYRIIENGVPDDAVLCGAVVRDGRTLILTFHSETFPDVKEGEEIPFFAPKLETVAQEASAQ